jgi:hypothetical protein
MDIALRGAMPRIFGKLLLGIAVGLSPLAVEALVRVVVLAATIQAVFLASVYLQYIGGCIVFAAAFALMCVFAINRRTRLVSLGLLIGLLASAGTAIFWLTEQDWSTFFN